MHDASEIVLSCAVTEAAIEVTVRNGGTAPLRLWRRSNSWGWETLRLRVAPAGRPDEATELRPAPVIWTRDGPSFDEVAPGESRVDRIAPGDVTWLGRDAVRSVAGLDLRVEPVLDVPPTPEATAEAVFVGRVTGRPCRSKPPHRWLFG